MSDETLEGWLAGRHQWLQSAAAGLLARQTMPSPVEVAALAELCLSEASGEQCQFDTMSEGALALEPPKFAFRISKIADISGVNALKDGAGLDFGCDQIVAVFGTNGAGKSGFARTFKNACGAKTREPLLPNVFKKNDVAPAAAFHVVVDASERVINWSNSTGPCADLRHVHVFDTATAQSYFSDGNLASYEPRRLRFITRLIEIVDAVAQELDRRAQAHAVPCVTAPLAHAETAAYKFIQSISDTTSSTDVEEACSWNEHHQAEVKLLVESLAVTDVTRALSENERKLRLLSSVASKIDAIKHGLSEGLVDEIRSARADVVWRREVAIADAANVFSGAALDGIGTASWRSMWEAARLYSTTHAYVGRNFPAVEAEDHCVLCQQSLGEDAARRLQSFETFVRGALEADAQKAEQALRNLIARIPNIPPQQDWLAELDAIGYPGESALRLWEQLAAARAAAVNEAMVVFEPVHWPELEAHIASARISLAEEASNLRRAGDEAQRKALALALAELRAREWLSQNRSAVLQEQARHVALARIKKARSLASTIGLTKKKNELAQAELAAGYQNRFNAELARLGGKRIPIQMSPIPEGKGKIAFKIELIGASTNARVGAVLSEGESRIVALAAFLADIGGSGMATPFVFDDPISSLDHSFEQQVADRLVELACTRQVIVFTHRLSLLALLEDAIETFRANPAELPTEPPSFNILALRSLGGRTGFVEALDVRREAPEKGFSKLRDHRLPRVRKHFSNADIQAFESELKSCCADFRILVERSVEKILLAGLVERFRRSIQTRQITDLSKIDRADCGLIERMMGKYSRFEHSQPDEMDASLPEVDEFEADVAEMQAWASEFRKRPAKVATQMA